MAGWPLGVSKTESASNSGQDLYHQVSRYRHMLEAEKKLAGPIKTQAEALRQLMDLDCDVTALQDLRSGRS